MLYPFEQDARDKIWDIVTKSMQLEEGDPNYIDFDLGLRIQTALENPESPPDFNPDFSAVVPCSCGNPHCINVTTIGYEPGNGQYLRNGNDDEIYVPSEYILIPNPRPISLR